MKNIRYSDFKSVGNILDSVIQNSDLQAGIKKTTLAKFWPKIVGRKFENLSKPASLTQTGNKGGILYVACANSFVTSELLMFKTDILKKLEPYAKPLGLEVDDIVFSHKIWREDNVEEEETQSFNAPDKPEIDYDSIILDEEEIAGIKRCTDNNKFASEEQRQRMFEAIVKDLKYQKSQGM